PAELHEEPAAVQEQPAATQSGPLPVEIAAAKEAGDVRSGVLAAESAPEPEPKRPNIEIIYEPPQPAQVVSDDEAPAASSDGSPEPDEARRADDNGGVQPLPGLISAEFQPPLEAIGGLGVETSEDVVLEVSGNSEFSVPDASEDLKSVAARLASSRPPSPSEEKEPAPAVADEYPLKTQPAPEFVLTESMAEVLAKQGHSEDAIRVYRELIRRNGESPELEARIRELESQPVGQPPKQRSYSARDTNGQSVGAFFQAMLASRVSGAGDAGNRENTARPDTAAQNGGGFLESSYGEQQSLPVPPAVPSEAPTEAAVSFDDFFNSERGESTPLPQGKGEAGKDDLDQFQTWLQNLKR
ncbi:MAG TPA: hypothetical protein VE420_11280, partial [Gemmatimonadales bacterium]|nr:hypothetical protein [Gemmatimonadales bacterium]